MSRSLRRTPALATLLAALAAPAAGAQDRPAAPPAPAPANGDRLTLQVPDRVGEFVFRTRHDYDDPADGLMLRYARVDRLTVDVFLYPGPDLGARCALACADSFATQEAATFEQSLPELVRRRYADSLAVVTRQTLTPGSGDRWRVGRHLVLGERAGGRALQSDFYLFLLPGVQVKVRATYPPDSVRASAVATFAMEDLVPAVTGTAPAHVQVEATLPGRQAAVYARALAALRRAGYAVADSSAAEGTIRTAPRYAWPTGGASGGDAAGGVELLVRVRAAGDSTRLTVTGRAPTVAGWPDRRGAQLLEMTSVIAMAGEITGTERPGP